MTLAMGKTAEEVAVSERITRAKSDAFALRRRRGAVAADIAPHFVLVTLGDAEVIMDGAPRPDVMLERRALLHLDFCRDGVVTPGSPTSLPDGVAALEEAVCEHGLTVRDRTW
ncbi:hypothetical protein [Nocardia sp. CY41]|uniref:thiolase family protein n=1 Tax=Nocardia sp. CY41 TaxID=2608686 RepID=UPI001359C7C5|nr:hypothetical protein [Nocardia sp. CY41]